MTSFAFVPNTLSYVDTGVCDPMSLATQEEIKNEPMLFSVDVEYALRNAGPITREFIRCSGLAESKEKWIIDSRVHMLMPGWLPAIPGYHTDDCERSRQDGQPNYINPSYRATHLMAVVDSGTGSLTEFVKTPMILDEVPLGQTVYKVWNDEVKARVARGELETWQVKSGDIVRFGHEDFHRVMPAIGNGWRYFIRASSGTPRKFYNEIRKQVQVYMSDPEAGW
jgi:hypothetical protein